MSFHGQLGNQLGDIILAYNINQYTYIGIGNGQATIGGCAIATVRIHVEMDGGIEIDGTGVQKSSYFQYSGDDEYGLRISGSALAYAIGRICNIDIGYPPPILEPDQADRPDMLLPWEEPVYIPCYRDYQNVDCVHLREVYPICRVRNDRNCTGQKAYVPATTICQQKHFYTDAPKDLPSEEVELSILSAEQQKPIVPIGS